MIQVIIDIIRKIRFKVPGIFYACCKKLKKVAEIGCFIRNVAEMFWELHKTGLKCIMMQLMLLCCEMALNY